MADEKRENLGVGMAEDVGRAEGSRSSDTGGTPPHTPPQKQVRNRPEEAAPELEDERQSER